MKFIIIDAPHFNAAIDFERGVAAPIIKYMLNWEPEKIVAYCKKKGWQISYWEN